MGDFHTMTTKSGRTFTPLSDYDVLEEIYQDMGSDVHDYVAERLLEIDVEANIAQQKFDSDYRAMEFECERWHDFVDDMSERIVELSKKIEDNKLTKAKIGIELFQIYKDMRGEL